MSPSVIAQSIADRAMNATAVAPFYGLRRTAREQGVEQLPVRDRKGQTHPLHRVLDDEQARCR